MRRMDVKRTEAVPVQRRTVGFARTTTAVPNMTSCSVIKTGVRDAPQRWAHDAVHRYRCLVLRSFPRPSRPRLIADEVPPLDLDWAVLS